MKLYGLCFTWIMLIHEAFEEYQDSKWGFSMGGEHLI
jgi:hypothetical protein